MIGVQNRVIGIKETGHTVTVPDSPMACIMYYLSCVNSLIDINIPENLRKYHNYQNLSFDEENRVLSLATLLNPALFIANGIMINDPALCQNKSNKFFSITNSRFAFAFSREFVIANKKLHTLKIMAFKSSWLEKYYINPIKTYSTRISAIANGTVERFRPRRLRNTRTSNSHSTRDDQYYIRPTTFHSTRVNQNYRPTNYDSGCNIF